MSVRYALYLAPEAESPLWRFGSAIIGYDAETGAELEPPDLAGFDGPSWRALTREPRRYGFHGTLKAPFRLKPGLDRGDLLDAVAAIAGNHRPFELPPLEVSAIGPFIALTPQVPVPALDDLAACAVRELDGLRAPLNTAEFARRRPNALSHRQRELLEDYGYPYVLDEYRFHMTLTGPLGEGEHERAFNALCSSFAASTARTPVEIADVAVFVQDGPKSRFRLKARLPLGG